MKKIILGLLLLIPILSSAQNRKMLIFDLHNNHADTIETDSFDPLVMRDQTDYYIGDYDDNYCNLNQTVPVDNVYPRCNFTKKVQASRLYDINDFPIRTSVKIFRIRNDSLKSKCSGSLISQRHVLTARHCVADFFSDTLLIKSFYVCPAFDNGQKNLNFDCASVSKIYMFEKAMVSDLCILELDKPIGKQTGWISIGFDSDNTSILDGIFYKFSYPAKTMPEFDSHTYNGDTLYCGYGNVNMAEDSYLEVLSAVGIRGESGSSLIKVENRKSYTSYGVLSYSSNLSHSRIRNRDFYPFKAIINNETNGNADIPEQNEILIYPNPTLGPVYIENTAGAAIKKMVLFDLSGRKLFENNNTHTIDLSAFPSGTYFMQIRYNQKSTLIKIIKYGP